MKIWRNYKEQVLFLSFILSLIGLFNVFNSSYVLAMNTGQSPYHFLLSQAAALVVGVVVAAFFAGRRRGYNWLANVKTEYLIAVVIIVLLLAVQFVGINVNGSRRWLNLGITFQPSELAKISMVFLSAAFVAQYFNIKKSARYVSLISPPLIFALIEFVLVLKQPDLGTAIVIFCVFATVYLAAGIRPRVLVSGAVLAVLVVIPAVYHEAYRLDRIKAWINPWQYAQSIGYQSCQSMMTIGSGKFFGMQFGMGLSKFFYLPEAHTDFAFAIWAQESGFIGATLLLVLFFAFARTGICIAMKAEDVFGRMLAVGITFLIAGQAFINIAMVTGLLPVVGVPLPFISYGGTSLVINWIAVGVLANVAGKIREEEPANEKAAY